MNILAIETTCDETAAAVVTDRLEVVSSVVASQDDLHRRFGGVVPEIASRAQLERIMPVIDETLRQAGLSPGDLDAVAVANTPGLAGSLLVGLVAAKALCVALEIPLIAVNHLQAHIYACRLAGTSEAGTSEEDGRPDVFPCVGLIVSGGHTSLCRCGGPLDFELLGSTIDDAAGEAFDKVASMLGLPYPGGPAIERAARGGNPDAHCFPRALLKDEGRLDFSFSGLKTAVRYAITGPGRGDPAKVALSDQQVADLAASFQEAVVDCLVGKAFAALRRTGLRILCTGGGVAANSRLRQRLDEEADRQRVALHVAPIRLCTDNAVMGAIAVERLRAGLFEDLDLDVYPGVVRGASGPSKATP
ncbi:MAG: tRNA (adenosine(37)-N6)-threonylcarbamoyltransferase complex transferase subunit TsaD [Planctomycetes bacterium RBG_13_63_9]|nr:MAG: tRNA (adenosine(37)-N6)-threonylcarbamoyltransferase complex transferase subunit TsaD [Planctomycetes bacterium RBG_13_63_9]